MSELWPHWQRPFWLLLLPLLAWLLWKLWHRRRRTGRWELLLPPVFQAALLRRVGRRGSRLPWIALGLAWLIALLALLGPSWQRIEQPTGKRADPLVVLLQMTPSMLAGDVAPNRLEQAKHKLLDLLAARQEAQTAVVVYAGSAHVLVPLSDDLGTTRNLLDALQPSIMPTAGQRADLALDKALALLDQGAQGQSGRVLLIASALDESERRGMVERLDGREERLDILGIGTPQGAPVPLADGGFLKDEQGTILLPRLDSAGLARVAGKLGGRYQTASLDDRDLRQLHLLRSPHQLHQDSETSTLSTWADQGHWLLLPLLLLAACAGRRGWLLCLPLLLVQPQTSHAFEFADLWARPDQQGQHLLTEGRPSEAASRFENRQWQGLALYQAGDYAAAAERFAEGRDAAAHYNRGNALARGGELEAALDAYARALELQPDLEPAVQNKALVEELLRQQEQAQASQPGERTEQTEPGNDAASEETDGQSPSALAGTDQETPTEPSPQSVARQGGTLSAAAGPEDSGEPAKPGIEPAGDALEELGEERRQALEQWLRQIPDNPGELLRRKFWYEQRQHQETTQ